MWARLPTTEITEMQSQQSVAELGFGFGGGVAEMQTLIAELVAALRGREPVSLPISGRHLIGEIEIDEHFRTVRRNGNEIALRPKEYDLLIALARRHGAPVSKKVLLEEVWQVTVASDSRTLDQHIFELRRKLEADTQNPRHLITIRKFGYCLRRE